jgi:3-methylcrotonyl-CoA carboxylase alpha subunit
MFSRILIANRGEIACRVIRTCRRLGVETVAVYSDADVESRHVREADEAVRIGPPAPAESYLRADRIVEAAAAKGAEAIHPGYGFLSENPGLAEACEAAGIRFIGPSAGTIRDMGSKRRARRIMADAGVPVVPGYDGEDQDDQALLDAARAIGFPVILKPSGGGGGKGMRIVREESGWAESLAGARRESRAAFGDDRMILERYLERPRHVEVQVFADSHGNVLHLFERECSIQRRHQKIVEEAPSPVLSPGLREEMTSAAVAAARAANYLNAGTVEFLLDTDGAFYFMEMNTRLQVEHPVTEAITGVDLVEWQLRVADGEPLPTAQDDLTWHGHAIEARVYAENPFNDFLPSTGRIGRFIHPPGGLAFRVDSGVEDGDSVDIHYDPMVAKLIVWAEDRPAAVAGLKRVLASSVITGPDTNLPLLRRIAAHDDFAAGAMDTGYLDRHVDALLSAPPESDELALIVAACAMQLDAAARTRPPADPFSPWDVADGWRAQGGGTLMRFADGSGWRRDIRIEGWDGEFCVRLGDRSVRAIATRLDTDRMDVRLGDDDHQALVLTDGDDCFVGLDFGGFELRRIPVYESDVGHGEEDMHPVAPMPGRIAAIYVKEGDEVEPGQPLLVMEGMKMEYTLSAPVAGVVAHLRHRVGDRVGADTTLVDIDPAARGSE